MISGENVLTEIITRGRNDDFHFSPKGKNDVQCKGQSYDHKNYTKFKNFTLGVKSEFNPYGLLTIQIAILLRNCNENVKYKAVFIYSRVL